MRSHRALALVAPVAALLLLLPPRPATAQGQTDYTSAKGMDERLRVDLGGFFQKFTTTVRLDSETTGRGTEVNLEDDLGLDSTQAALVGGIRASQASPAAVRAVSRVFDNIIAFSGSE